MPGLAELMGDIEAREVRLVEVTTEEASPFARSLLFGYVAQFMYDGDSPLAERRAAALSLDSRLLSELLGQAELRELLDPEAIDQVERELQWLTDDRRARDAESVADLLRVLGPLTDGELAERGADPAWAEELAAARRAIRVRVASREHWAAIEDAGRLRDALGTALPEGVPAAFREPVPEPLEDLIARYARTHGPFTGGEAAARFGLGAAVAEAAFERLAAAGRVVGGEFRPGGRDREWCDAEVLRRLRRRSSPRCAGNWNRSRRPRSHSSCRAGSTSEPRARSSTASTDSPAPSSSSKARPCPPRRSRSSSSPRGWPTTARPCSTS
ncbi:hypothetical protein GCM10029992_14120 [Glycomyces albus]